MLDCCSIYDPIARGKHSTVYKGRKKQSIMYFAIKSVDKCQKPRVLQEVRQRVPPASLAGHRHLVVARTPELATGLAV